MLYLNLRELSVVLMAIGVLVVTPAPSVAKTPLPVGCYVRVVADWPQFKSEGELGRAAKELTGWRLVMRVMGGVFEEMMQSAAYRSDPDAFPVMGTFGTDDYLMIAMQPSCRKSKEMIRLVLEEYRKRLNSVQAASAPTLTISDDPVEGRPFDVLSMDCIDPSLMQRGNGGE